jgi:predicted esterase
VRGLLELDSPGQEYKFNPKGFEIPAFLSHGETDEKVRFKWGKQMQDIPCKLNVDVTFRGYEGLAHWWNDYEIKDVVKFLKSIWG